jgi:hypothetical protein
MPEEPKPRPASLMLAILVPLGLIAVVAAVVYAISRLLGG